MDNDKVRACVCRPKSLRDGQPKENSVKHPASLAIHRHGFRQRAFSCLSVALGLFQALYAYKTGRQQHIRYHCEIPFRFTAQS